MDDFFPLLEKVRDSFQEEDYKEIKRHVGNVKKNVENAETAVDHLANKIPTAKIDNNDKDEERKPDFEAYIDLVKFVEEYRWLGTVCFYTWTALVGLLLIGGNVPSKRDGERERTRNRTRDSDAEDTRESRKWKKRS